MRWRVQWTLTEGELGIVDVLVLYCLCSGTCLDFSRKLESFDKNQGPYEKTFHAVVLIYNDFATFG